MFYKRLGTYSLLFMLFEVSVANAAQKTDFDKLSSLSLSDLQNIVTSVSKRPEEAFTAPAAVYVITQEDIKNSGLRSIPEILRMAPGVQVTQTDIGDWAITARGFNADGFGNKLLVLMDGRSVYTPLFSGVYWDAQDTFIDDIDRIEIIRGPGATLWGANAVNGVINIITKSAKDTQTNVVNVGIGTRTRDFQEARHGGVYDNDVFYRVYAKRFDYTSDRTVTGEDAKNGGWSNRAGFRIDWDKSEKDSLTFQGDVYDNKQDWNLSLPDGTTRPNDHWLASGLNIVTRWNHVHDDNAKSSLQTYFDHTYASYSPIESNISTIDFDYQYDTNFNDKNNVIMGVGYRYVTDKLPGSSYILYTPVSWGRSLYSTFIQDTFKIIPEKLHFTFGSKFEHNDFTGFEYEPSARIGWYPNEKNTVWASISRAVRTPNRSENDLSLAVAPGLVRWLGNHDFKSERLIAYELGYRLKPTDNLLFDATTFINQYDRLRTNEVSFTNLPPDTILGLPFDNKAKAISKGFELSSTWLVTKYWQLKGSYTFLTIDIETVDDSTDTTVESQSGMSPKNQFNLQSQLYLSHSVELSNSLYYVQNLPTLEIPGYYRFDSRIMWTAKPGLELSLIGQNLLKSQHQEFSPTLYGVPTNIGRNIYGKVTVRF
jgi:iron complex outermembrane recepter protein